MNYNLHILHLVIYDNIHAAKFSFQILKRFSIKTMYVVPCMNGLCFSSLIHFNYCLTKLDVSISLFCLFDLILYVPSTIFQL